MIEFTPAAAVGALVAFLLVYYGIMFWPRLRRSLSVSLSVRMRSTQTGKLEAYSSAQMGRAGKYLMKCRKPANNANMILNRAFGAPRAFLYSSACLRPPAAARAGAEHRQAIITQEKEFPDVSFWQGAINWDIMRTKTDAVIIRAGQNLWVDTKFVRNWTEAKRVGMRRGVYWFYDDRVSPGKQAEILISLLKDDREEMEIFIDYEKVYDGAFGGASNVVAMMQAIERALPGADVSIYTGFWFWREHTNPVTNFFQYQYLKNRPLWLAWYSDASVVQIPQPWTKLTHWQFGTPAVGEEYGVQSVEIDMNFFNGTETEFALRYGGVLPGEPPPTGETMDRWKATWDKGLNKRPAPNTNNVAVGVIADNAEFDVMGYFIPDGKTEVQERWGRLPDGYWVALVHNSQVRAVLVSVPPAGEITIPDYLVAHFADGTEKKYIPE